MATAKKTRNGKWRVRVYLYTDENGKIIMKSFTAKTKKEAEYLATDFIQNNSIVTPALDYTLSKAITEYINAKKDILSPSTIRGYNSMSRNRYQNIMNLKVRDISQMDLQKAINADALDHSPKSVKNGYSLISAVLHYVMPDKHFHVALPAPRKNKPKFLTEKEAGLLIKAIKGDSCELPILIALWLGMRHSEILGLTWDCIDFKNKKLEIKQAYILGDNGFVQKEGAKTYMSNRTLICPDYILDKLKELSVGKSPDERIFTMHPCTIRRHLTEICKVSQLPLVGMHDLRRTNASIMMANNIPVRYARERGGWEDNATMDKIYVQTFKDERDKVDTVVNQIFENYL